VLSVVDGGINGWLESGGTLVKGTPPDKIYWAIKVNINEITVEDFKKALAGDLPGTFIIDIRNVGEVEDGKFPITTNIPLDDLTDRLGELPKDKEILVHCSTGVRADMAVHELLKAGFKARYVVVTVECIDGECKLLE
jgi:rhodanese-related sulfurtransferase